MTKYVDAGMLKNLLKEHTYKLHMRGDVLFSETVYAMIDALSTTDVVGRDAVCPHYIKNVHDRGDDSLCGEFVCEVKELLPRSGRWIHDGDRIVCSECGAQFHWSRKTNYCPECGSHNRGDDNG